MGEENKKPYILYVAEAIYLEIFKIKKQNNDIPNIDAIERVESEVGIYWIEDGYVMELIRCS